MRIYPDSFAFTLLLGLMASLPTFGIDAPPPQAFRRREDDLGTTSVELGLATELALSTILATSLLLMGGKSGLVVVLAMVGVALSFGSISPYATKEALRQIAEVMGSISARTFVQMIGAASSSAIDGHSVFLWR